MTKQEFLDELRQCLVGEVSSEAVMDAYRYYSTYIEDEVRTGKSEEAVIEELGKPALIARSIIAAQTGERLADEEYMEDGRTRHHSRRKDYSNAEPKTVKESKEFVFDFNAWYAKLIFAAFLVVLIILVYFILKLGFWVLITFGVPILIVLGIIYLIMYFMK